VGIRHLDIPTGAEKIWRAINASGVTLAGAAD